MEFEHVFNENYNDFSGTEARADAAYMERCKEEAVIEEVFEVKDVSKQRAFLNELRKHKFGTFRSKYAYGVYVGTDIDLFNARKSEAICDEAKATFEEFCSKNKIDIKKLSFSKIQRKANKSNVYKQLFEICIKYRPYMVHLGIIKSDIPNEYPFCTHIMSKLSPEFVNNLNYSGDQRRLTILNEIPYYVSIPMVRIISDIYKKTISPASYLLMCKKCAQLITKMEDLKNNEKNEKK